MCGGTRSVSSAAAPPLDSVVPRVELERTGYHRCHTEWRGHHPVPDSTSLEQQWAWPGICWGAASWHFEGTPLSRTRESRSQISDTLNCDHCSITRVIIGWHGASRVMAGGMRSDSRGGVAMVCPARWPWSTRQLHQRPSTSPTTTPSWRSTKPSVSACQPGIRSNKPSH